MAWGERFSNTDTVYGYLISFFDGFFALWFEYDDTVLLSVHKFLFFCFIKIYYNTYICYIFLFFCFLMICVKFTHEYSSIYEKNRTDFFMYYKFILYDTTNNALDKFESIDEALCVIVLFPWCFLLVFTHAFFIDNNEIIFFFVEWGLPVVYGVLMLVEHMWNFGVYFFVYLSGGRGRRSFFLTLGEDLLNLLIVLIRVCLQVVRGLLCGLMHKFFKDLVDQVVEWHHTFFFIWIEILH